MLDFLELLLLVVVIFYFYYQLDKKIEDVNRQIKNETRVINTKVSSLGQLLTSYFRNNP